jgi:broad specificity phosphatase PhoE
MLHLIRHAESEMNSAKQQNREQNLLYSQTGVVWDMRLVDPAITATGLQQVLAAREQVLALRLDRVYVSPMLRALQTCEGLIEGHACHPEVVVLPDATEIISDSGDLSKGNEANRRLFPLYDWSRLQALNPVYWMASVSDSPFLQSTVASTQSTEEIIAKLCQEMQRKHPDHLESKPEARRRILSLHSILQADMEAGLHVAVVAHGDILRSLMKTFLPAGESIFFQNCQVFTISNADLGK